MSILANLGVGAIAAWTALPLLGWLASRDNASQQKHRALGLALALSASFFAIPWVAQAVDHWLIALQGDAAGPGLVPGTVVSFAVAIVTPATRVGGSATAWIGGLWLLTVVAAHAALLARTWALCRIVSRSQSVAVSSPERADWARKIGVDLANVRISDEVSVPFTFGVVQSRVLVPTRLWQTLTREELCILLLHEQEHIARRDPALALGIGWLGSLFYGHPLRSWLVDSIVLAREKMVDERIACGQVEQYAQTLLRIAEVCMVKQHWTTEEVGMASSSMVKRVQSLLGNRASSRRGGPSIVIAAASLLFVPLVVVVVVACVDGAETANSAGSKLNRPAEPATAGQPIAMGALPKEAIQKVLTANKEQIRSCYEAGLQQDPALAGKLATHWVIDAEGVVTKVSIKSSTIDNPRVESCIRDRIATWVFPKPAGGGIVEINYPFVFRSQ